MSRAISSAGRHASITTTRSGCSAAMRKNPSCTRRAKASPALSMRSASPRFFTRCAASCSESVKRVGALRHTTVHRLAVQRFHALRADLPPVALIGHGGINKPVAQHHLPARQRRQDQPREHARRAPQHEDPRFRHILHDAGAVEPDGLAGSFPPRHSRPARVSPTTERPLFPTLPCRGGDLGGLARAVARPQR